LIIGTGAYRRTRRTNSAPSASPAANITRRLGSGAGSAARYALSTEGTIDITVTRSRCASSARARASGVVSAGAITTVAPVASGQYSWTTDRSNASEALCSTRSPGPSGTSSW
jgi:hypothetical protein